MRGSVGLRGLRRLGGSGGLIGLSEPIALEAAGHCRARRILRIAAIVAGALAYWRLVIWNPSFDLKPLDAWLFLPTDPFPQVMYLITAAVVYRRRNLLKRAMGSPGSATYAALPLLAGTALFVWGQYVHAMDLVLISFILVSIGAGWLWFGARFARELAIPWTVLAFAYPFPGVVSNQAFYVLRLWTAANAAAFLRLAGIPIVRDGNVISGPGVTASVIDTCSGLRSVEILILAAIFYVSWFPARRVRQVLLIAVAPLIAYLFNVVRICVIAVEPTSEYSAAHTMQGLTVYGGAIACLIVVDRILGRLLPSKTGSAANGESGTQGPLPPERRSESPPQPAIDSVSASRASGLPSAAAMAALAVAMLCVSIWMPRWSEPKPPRLVRIDLPAELDGWKKTSKIELDDGFLWTVRYERFAYWKYERDGDEISVFVGEDDHSNRRHSLLSRKNDVPGRGFAIIDRNPVAIESIDVPVVRVLARSRLAYAVAYHWYEETDSLPVEIVRAVFALDQSPFRRSQPAWAIRIATVVGSTPDGQANGDAKLRAFAASLEAALHAGRG
jgi:exosortase